MGDKENGVLQRELKEVFSEMRAALAEVCGLETRTTEKTIDAWWRVGKRVNEVKANSRRYGERAIPVLAAALSKALSRQISDVDLWVAANVANVYPEKEYIDNLVARAKEKRVSFTYSHLRALSSSELKLDQNADKRKEWEERILNEGLTAEALFKALRKARGSTRRLAKVPKSPYHACQQIIKACRDLSDRVNDWTAGLAPAGAPTANPDALHAKLGEGLEEAVKAVLDARGGLTVLENKLNEVTAVLSEYLERKAQAAEAVSDTEPPRRAKGLVEDEKPEEEWDDSDEWPEEEEEEDDEDFDDADEDIDEETDDEESVEEEDEYVPVKAPKPKKVKKPREKKIRSPMW